MNLLIAFNVFSLYFVKNAWYGKNSSLSEGYQYGSSLIFSFSPIVVFLLILLKEQSGDFDEIKAPLFLAGLLPIAIGMMFNTKITAAVNDFQYFKYRHYYFLFLLYMTFGLAGLLWLTYQGIGK